jgi:hypothetical protein
VVAISAPREIRFPTAPGPGHLQGRRQQRRTLHDVLAAAGLVDGLQATVAHRAPDHAEPGVPEIGRGVVQHRRPAGLRDTGHHDDPPVGPVRPGVAPRTHDPVDDVGEVARVRVGAVDHPSASSTSAGRRRSRVFRS